MLRPILALVCAFVVTLATGPIIIPWLKKLKFGQNVRSFGPKSHLKKQGVPTMGGIMIMLSLLGSSIAFSYAQGRLRIMIPVLLFVAFCSLIGFADDFISIRKKRSMGLRARDKTWMLLLVSTVFAFYCYNQPEIGSSIYVPFTSVRWDLGWAYIPFTVFVIYATVNSANITDGADGLLSGVTLIVSAALCVIFYYGLTTQSESIFGNCLILAAATTGACLGFLLFNHYPARIIMGDTGSFGLGAAVTALMLVSGMTLYIPILCFMYVLSSLSDILQKLSYMIRRHRLFKMAPLHHHLELSGWKEPTIVATYMGITLVMAAVTLYAVG